MPLDRDAELVSRDPARAAVALAAGGLVVLPTETVYGLGADAEQPGAIARIYQVKGRPSGHPLIVHGADAELLDRYSAVVPRQARLLAQACWPGPLTLVLQRSDRLPPAAAGGLSTVALRVPNHPMTLAVLSDPALHGHGVAAPSANRFGRVSPTSTIHVLADLQGRLNPATDLVLEGGLCAVGLESTIVDLSRCEPSSRRGSPGDRADWKERPGPGVRVLRQGAVSAAELCELLGEPVSVHDTVADGGSPTAPGMLASHYAPRAAVVLCSATELTELAERLREQGRAVFELDPRAATLTEYARSLYSWLRQADEEGADVVLAVPPAGDGLAAAVRDRLTRAAAPR